MSAGYEVHVVDNFHLRVHGGCGVPTDLSPDTFLHPGDITSAEGWRANLRVVRPDTVAHLAAETGTRQFLREAGRHAEVNVVGTATMVDAPAESRHAPSYIVLASSRAVYGAGAWRSSIGAVLLQGPRSHSALATSQWGHLNDHGISLEPIASVAGQMEPRLSSIYAATKLSQEHILSAWRLGQDCALSVLRFQNVYGHGQSVTNSYMGFLSFFVRTALTEGAIDVFEDGATVRDFVYLDDIVSGATACIARVPGESRLIDPDSGPARTIHEAARIIANLAAAPEPVCLDGCAAVTFAQPSVILAQRDTSWITTPGHSRGRSCIAHWLGRPQVCSNRDDFRRQIRAPICCTAVQRLVKVDSLDICCLRNAVHCPSASMRRVRVSTARSAC